MGGLETVKRFPFAANVSMRFISPASLAVRFQRPGERTSSESEWLQPAVDRSKSLSTVLQILTAFEGGSRFGNDSYDGASSNDTQPAAQPLRKSHTVLQAFADSFWLQADSETCFYRKHTAHRLELLAPPHTIRSRRHRCPHHASPQRYAP